jgi:hypothetical protein
MTYAPPCDESQHNWEFVKDWYGDPTIPNGTCDCSFFRCKRCGEERAEAEVAGPDPDELYERMREERDYD